MTAKTIQTKIRLGDMELNALQLRSASYERPALCKLDCTDIYLYGDDWYWLHPKVPSALEKYTFHDSDRGGTLSVQGNRLSHLYIDPFRGAYQSVVKIAYIPIPRDIHSVLHYCSLGETIPGNVMERLYAVLDQFVVDLGELGRVVL
jgi:hypothetical protein